MRMASDAIMAQAIGLSVTGFAIHHAHTAVCGFCNRTPAPQIDMTLGQKVPGIRVARFLGEV